MKNKSIIERRKAFFIRRLYLGRTIYEIRSNFSPHNNAKALPNVDIGRAFC